jgi:LemA protein
MKRTGDTRTVLGSRAEPRASTLRSRAEPRASTLRSRAEPRASTAWLTLLVALFSFAGCGYNEVIERDEDVKGAWAEVQNQYQRRADLVPNLVNVVKGSANFERETLEKVVQARASVGSIKVDASIVDDPQKLKQFEAAQSQLSGALSRLLAVSEAYPDLKASAQFRDLQAQLEGTENRIAVARRRYIEEVAAYNKVVLLFPSSIGAGMRGKKERPTFTTDAVNEKPPEVKL